jgi:hypothetical protein
MAIMAQLARRLPIDAHCCLCAGMDWQSSKSGTRCQKALVRMGWLRLLQMQVPPLEILKKTIKMISFALLHAGTDWYS